MASLQELLNAQSAVADRSRAKDWSARNRAAFGGVLDVNQFLPVTGDIQSGILAAQDLNQGDYGSAALNALGLLPFVPAMGGMIKNQYGRIPETGKETQALAEMLERAGIKKGYDVNLESSKISPSKYISFSKEGLDPVQIRLSNHPDYNKSLAGGYKRVSVDPSTNMTFEQSVNWLKSKGYPTSLSSRYAYIPSMEEAAETQRILTQQRLNEIAKQQAIKESSIQSQMDLIKQGNIDAIEAVEIKKVEIGSKKRKGYEILGQRIEASEIPAEIKTSQDRTLLRDYLLQKIIGD